jgi:hypothetical protein
MRRAGYTLQSNSRAQEGRQHPERDAQFRYIAAQAEEHLDAGQPVISVDAKKREQVGNYAPVGREWAPGGTPVVVRSHDFPDKDGQHAVPYGVYDGQANAGFVNVGTDGNTAALAVESVRRWWNLAGKDAYPDVTRLLVTADAGGSNGYKNRAWKAGLAALAQETGLDITVCHFPPGTSKWNKIEHRLFSHITMNWRGRPLASHQIIVHSIAATVTRAGLAVHAELDTGAYPLGAAVSDARMDALPAVAHYWHGEWNYTVLPAPAAPASPPGPAPATAPDLAWLAHPAITGMTGPALDTLTAALAGPAAALRDAQLDRRRGYQPRQQPPGTGRRPRITVAAKLLAVILRDRHGLPCKATAALLGIRHELTSRYTSDIRRLLRQIRHVIQPSPHQFATLADLCAYATAHGITIPAKINTTC